MQKANKGCSVCGDSGRQTRYGNVCRICERAIEREFKEDMEAISKIERIIDMQKELVGLQEIGVVSVGIGSICLKPELFEKWFGIHGDVTKERINDTIRMEKIYAGKRFITWKEDK